MKLMLFLFSASAVMALMFYDYYAFTRASSTVAVLNEVNTMLDVRGRQRYEIQQFHTDLLQGSTPSQVLSERFQRHPLIIQDFAIEQESATLTDWNKRDLLEEKREQFSEAKSAYLDIPLDQLPPEARAEALAAWYDATIALLDEIQWLDLDLSGYLTQQVTERLKYTVFVNGSILAGVFVVVLLSLYLSQRASLKESQAANQLLAQRQQSLQSSRRQLISLSEDLNHEKNAATLLSRDLQQANQALQQNNQEMEQFIYTVSHDLKSPLVTIGGFAQKLNQELTAQLTEKQRHWLQRIRHNVNHMESLLGDLLRLSRVIRQQLEKQPVDVEGLLEQQRQALEELLNEAQARFLVHSPLHAIVANERLLSQCLANLITNAVKYREPERPLVIDIATEQDAQHTRLMVKDNGVGIAPQYQEKVFRIFERLGQGDGTGVGLTIVKTVMEKHGGSVSLESEPGVGSQFCLHFPKELAA